MASRCLSSPSSSTIELFDSQLSLSMASLPPVPPSPPSKPSLSLSMDDDEDEESSEVTVNRPIRPSDYGLREPPSKDPPTVHDPEPEHAPSPLATQLSRPPVLSSSRSSSQPDSLVMVPSIDRCDSPISLSSWNACDMVSYPASSFSGSLDGDPDRLSDHDISRNGPLTDGEGEEISDEDGASRNGQAPLASQFDDFQHAHTRSPEFLSTVTGHLVMPRLPIHQPGSNAPSPGSSLRGGSSSRSAGSNSARRITRNYSHRPSRASQPDQSAITHAESCFQAWTYSPDFKPHVLLIGAPDGSAQNPSLSVGGPSLSIQRATQLVAGFKMSDPATHNMLFSHLSEPFTRLRPLLNPNALHLSNPTGMASHDLYRLIDSWCANDAYLIALVEFTQAPICPETVGFLLSLSRLVPILPFVSKTISGPPATDLQAILTRQLSAKRIPHFPIVPVPRSSPDLPLLPALVDCIIRSRDCFLDWLVVEEAALRALNPSATSRHSSDLGLLIQDHEPDRWSEKLGARILCLSKQSVLTLPTPPYHRAIKAPSHCSGLSSDPFGMPSMTSVLKVGLGHLKLGFIRLFQGALVRARPIRQRPPWILITAAATVFTFCGYGLFCG